MAFKNDISTVLVAAGVAPVTSIFIGSSVKIPDGAGPIVSIIVTGGAVEERTQNRVTTRSYDRPTAQITIRATDPVVAHDKAAVAYGAIDKVRNQNVNGVWYKEMSAMPPFDSGLDDKDRMMYKFNLSAIKRPS